MKTDKYIVSTKRLKGKDRGKISRFLVDSNNPNVLPESKREKGEFWLDNTWNVSLTHLLDEGEYMLLKKSDADKVKRHTGKTYEFVRVAEYEKTLAKRAKTRKKTNEAHVKRIQSSIEHWSKEPEERDELDGFFAIPEAQLDPKALAEARATRLKAKEANAEKHWTDGVIIRTAPQGENQEYQIKTASGVVICTHRTVDLMAENEPEPLKDEPKQVSKLPSPKKAQRVILPDSEAEIDIPDNFTSQAGMRLIRYHRNIRHEVLITDEFQYEWLGTVYKTLTEISWKAAGYQISGNAFFGLPSKKRS